jgi:hypothetical protein
VHFGDFPTSKGGIKTLDAFFESKEVRSDATEQPEGSAKVSQTLSYADQRLKERKKQLAKGFSVHQGYGEVRGHYNDNNKDIENNDSFTNVVANPSDLRDSTGTEKAINTLIRFFKEVNPSYKTFFANRTQRGALKRLLKEIGREELECVLNTLAQTNAMQYAPVITTPLELEKKIAHLSAFIQKKKNELPKIVSI